MVETKYSKYFITECTRNVEKFGKMVSLRNIKPAFENSNVDGGGRYYSEPFVMIPTKHVHKYDD